MKKEKLREAFRAGFMESGEGHNGEWHNESEIEEDLRKAFEDWYELKES